MTKLQLLEKLQHLNIDDEVEGILVHKNSGVIIMLQIQEQRNNFLNLSNMLSSPYMEHYNDMLD